MSKVTLKRVKRTESGFEEEKKHIIDRYQVDGLFDFNEDDICQYCEDIMVDGASVQVEINDELIDQIVFSDDEKYYNKKYIREAELASYLAKVFKDFPKNMIYDANLWTYLNTCVFFKYIKELYFKDVKIYPADRLERYLFNVCSHSKIDRTGMRFLWYFGDKLALDESEERALVAMEYIDPVKAIFERKMSCNDYITKAFVDAIILGGKNKLLKNPKMKIAVPKHIQCYAGVTNLDAFDYDELVDIFVREQARILSRAK